MQQSYFFRPLPLDPCFDFLSNCICFSFTDSLVVAFSCSVLESVGLGCRNFCFSSRRTASPQPCTSGKPCVVQKWLLQYLQWIAKSLVRFLHFTNEQVLSIFFTLSSTLSRLLEAVASRRLSSLFFSFVVSVFECVTVEDIMLKLINKFPLSLYWI